MPGMHAHLQFGSGVSSFAKGPFTPHYATTTELGTFIAGAGARCRQLSATLLDVWTVTLLGDRWEPK